MFLVFLFINSTNSHFFGRNIVTCSFIKLLTTKMMNQQLVLLSMRHIQCLVAKRRVYQSKTIIWTVMFNHNFVLYNFKTIIFTPRRGHN